MKIVTADQMREIESRSERAGVSTDTLMENAGLAVAKTARRMAGPLTGVPIVALIGPGNNGGDGLVTARHLARWGANVTAYLCRDRLAPDPKLDAAAQAGVSVVRPSEDPDLACLERLLRSAHLALDAVLGTGRARPILGRFEDILGALREAHRQNPRLRLLAMDLPTGLNSDTAEVDPACVTPDVTVSLGYPKRGHLAFPGADRVGSLEIADIGIPPGLDDDVPLELMTEARARAALPARPSDSHKGTYGRAMIVAGSRNFLGAARLAAMASLRVGAGLATIAVPESLIPSIAPTAIEPTFLPLPESRRGVVSPDAAELIRQSLDGYGSLLIGCGLGQAADSRRMAERLLLSGFHLPPTVVDADGLNALSDIPGWHERWHGNAILTPHPGEMSRLLGERVGPRRVETAAESASAWNKTVILKGAYTVVAYPDGGAVLSPFSNPALATAGTGDVLAGVIAGLLSQGVSMPTAAALGVWLHAHSAERLRATLGDAGLIATDLLSQLPQAIRALRLSVTRVG